MTVRSIIVDCDPGIDDAVALFLAFAARDELDLRAVTTVAGNVPLALTTRNALIIRQLAGRDEVAVHAGAPRPILRRAVTAEGFHGQDGLEGLDPVAPRGTVHPGHAVSAMIDLVRAQPGPVRLVATGPLTNLALAIVCAPDLLDKVEDIVIMAGAMREGGNITARSEFNVFADPHAAQIVLTSGAAITMISLDITHQVRATEARIAQVEAAGTVGAHHVARLLRASNRLEAAQNGAGAAPLHDPCTIAFCLDPALFSGRCAHVSVNLEPGDGFGETRVSFDASGPVTWLEMVEADGVFDLIANRLGQA